MTVCLGIIKRFGGMDLSEILGQKFVHEVGPKDEAVREQVDAYGCFRG